MKKSKKANEKVNPAVAESEGFEVVVFPSKYNIPLDDSDYIDDEEENYIPPEWVETIYPWTEEKAHKIHAIVRIKGKQKLKAVGTLNICNIEVPFKIIKTPEKQGDLIVKLPKNIVPYDKEMQELIEKIALEAYHKNTNPPAYSEKIIFAAFDVFIKAYDMEVQRKNRKAKGDCWILVDYIFAIENVKIKYKTIKGRVPRGEVTTVLPKTKGANGKKVSVALPLTEEAETNLDKAVIKSFKYLNWVGDRGMSLT